MGKKRNGGVIPFYRVGILCQKTENNMDVGKLHHMRICDPMGTLNIFFTHWNQVVTINWHLDVCTRHLWNFGDVTLADDDTNSTVWTRFELTPQVCPKGLFSVLTHFWYFFKLNSCTRQSFHSTFVNHGSKEKSNGLIWIYPPESVKKPFFVLWHIY